MQDSYSNQKDNSTNDGSESNINIAKRYIQSGMFSEAEPYLLKALELDEQKSLAYNYLGIIHFNNSEYKKSEKAFIDALRQDPNLLDVYFNLGMLYQKQGKFLEALPYYKTFVESNPDDAEVYGLMGQCAQCCGMVSESKAFFYESLRLSPNPKIAIDLSILLISQNEYDEAEKILSMLLDFHNDNENLSIDSELEALHFTMGLILKNQDKYNEAMGSFYNVVKINDQNEQAFNYLGECCLELGLEEEAESFFAKASKLDPLYSMPILNLGKLYFQQNDFYKTVLAMEKLIEVKGQLGDPEIENKLQDQELEIAYNVLGRAYLQLGETEKARKALQASLQINPDQPETSALLNSSKIPYKKTVLSIDD